MNFKKSVKNFSEFFHNNRIGGLRKIMTAYVSVFLAFLILIMATFSWFTLNDTSSVDSKTFTMEAASGLRVNDGEDLSNHIRFENVCLEESSSVDGRNFYFPTTGTFESDTSKMVFREGNVGDKNIKYACKDFTLKGDAGVTYVYIKSYTISIGDVSDAKIDEPGNEKFDGSTKIKYDSSGKPIGQEKHEECPIRVAFIKDSSEKPTVIDPTALVDNYVEEFFAVSNTNENGKAITTKAGATSFSDYYYGTGKPIFTLEGSTPVDVTMVVWFEGTGKNWDVYKDKPITVDVELESNWSDMEYIEFVDDTVADDAKDANDHGSNAYWIKGDDSNSCIVIMSYKDTDGSTKSVVMKELNNTHWCAYMPKDVITDISFYRYSLNDEVIYNAWHTKKGINNELSDTAKDWIKNDTSLSNLEENRKKSDGTNYCTYTAKRGNGWGFVSSDDPQLEQKRLSPCLGYWGYVSSGGGSGGGGTVGDRAKGNITLQIPEDLNWMRNDLIDSGSFDMYAIFSNGEKLKMNYDNGNCKVNYDVVKGTQLLRFEELSRYTGNSEGKPTTAISPITLTYSNYNYSFRVTDYGRKAELEN